MYACTCALLLCTQRQPYHSNEPMDVMYVCSSSHIYGQLLLEVPAYVAVGCCVASLLQSSAVYLVTWFIEHVYYLYLITCMYYLLNIVS